MKFFDYDSAFMRFALLLSRLTILNLIWLVSCLPLVTAGAATAAQYYSISRLIDGDPAVWKNFRAGLKLYWKRASVVWLILAGLSCAFFTSYYILSNIRALSGTPASGISGLQILTGAAVLTFLSILMVMLWVYPVMIRFTGARKDILFNAFIFAFMYAPITLIAVIVYGGMLFLLFRFTVTRGLCILFGQSLAVYVILTLFDKVFQKYEKTGEQ